MCGIIGVLGEENAPNIVLEGLKRLEYRGYDSAGIATVSKAGLDQRKEKGKIVALEARLQQDPLNAFAAIGHTRWATHGIPSQMNAHPHATEKVVVVHNGIIENYQALREQITHAGQTLKSDTDTEVIPHLITEQLNHGKSPTEAVRYTLEILEGAYALAILFADNPDLMIGARQGSPLALGYGEEDSLYLGSDAIALAPFCKKVSYLAEGDMVVMEQGKVEFYDKTGANVMRPIVKVDATEDTTDKGEYAHYMLKEIFEQPEVITRTLTALYEGGDAESLLSDFPVPLVEIDRVTLIACGTSHYAALIGRHWLETIARVSADVDIASEFRYRRPTMSEKGMAIFVSQSGETADTLAAMRYAKSIDQYTVALVNVAQSSMAIEADGMLHTKAGSEIGVASTKAFTTQLVALACLTLAIGKAKGTVTDEHYQEMLHALGGVSDLVREALHLESQLADIAKDLHDVQDMFYIGRGTSYALAYEGALKMKEISYIHAEAYAAGELKHGPLALIDDNVPVAVIAPEDELFEKTASNLQETVARGGSVILFSNKKGIKQLKSFTKHQVQMPECHPFVSPILYTVPLQLLAYHTAILRGTDVDQPRNLAKSVTVE